ncbi:MULTISPECIES: hypothetical protein [Haloferax]|uniref:Uncharacterized protein n=2 Tax=Haloferax TaxID=2251 RepID=A0A6G1YYJ6_9EURY|nr:MULTISPECIES: hypothetical protein [Haloferax]KAB1186773.1 hypothetical protein Hfx1149_01520 [Haloferax sp. CBA1149]MRW79399.1 hypothetical protein [Haloferax marinisediminis]
MATETQTELSGHLRGVTVTTLACLSGIAAAMISGVVVGTTVEAATNQLAVGILGAFVLVQFPVLSVIGIDISGAKDYLYVVFMTFALWFISYAILLTSGVQL